MLAIRSLAILLLVTAPFISLEGCRGKSAQSIPAGWLYPVLHGGKWGFADSHGRIVIPCKYDNAYASFEPADRYNAVEIGEDIVLIDRTGLEVTRSKGGMTTLGLKLVGLLAEPVRPSLDGSAPVPSHYSVLTLPDLKPVMEAQEVVGGDEPPYPIKRNGMWSLMDGDGNVLQVTLDCSKVSGFSDGLAAASIGKKKWGFIDASGKWVIEPKYSHAFDFSEGLAHVMSGGASLYIDKQGKDVFGKTFMVADNFSEGVALVVVGEKSRAYIDKSGKFILGPANFTGDAFSEGLAAVRMFDLRGKAAQTGYINKRGEFVIELKGAVVLERFQGGLARVVTKSASGYIDQAGDRVIKDEYKGEGAAHLPGD